MVSQSSQRRRASRHSKKRFRRLFVALSLLVLLVSPIVFIAMLTDRHSGVSTAVGGDARTAVRVKQLGQQLGRDLASGVEQARVTLNQADINGVVGVISSAEAGLAARINVTRWGLEGAMSVALSQWYLGDYLNVRFGIVPSTHGLRLSYLMVGSFNFSGADALAMGEWLLNQWLGSDKGSLVLGAISAVSMDGGETTITYHPRPELNQQFALLRARVKSMDDSMGLMGNIDVVRLYYSNVCRLLATSVPDQAVSLGRYLMSTFQLAQQRSALDNDPVAENRAALLGLGLVLASSEFEVFIGPVREGLSQDCSILTHDVTLAGRQNLRSHFIYSAMLRVLSDSGVSIEADDYVDMMDPGSRDGGFSFVNLLAERSGARFAGVALDKRGGAVRLQNAAELLIDESYFFPKMDNLREGISELEFEQKYGGIGGPVYGGVVKEIDGRLLTLSLYNRWLGQ